jgi:photoactive yellow protein
MSDLIEIHDGDRVETLDAERIARLTREEVDALPYGLMLFDHDGIVHLYNRYESLLSRRAPEQVVGKSWFRDVAPCTRVSAFEGRFRAFIARGDGSEILRFDFRFHFLHGAQDVNVTFAHVPGDAGPGAARVMVIVARRALGDGGRTLDITDPVAARATDGRARGGLGAALPAPRAFWAAAFDDDPTALERGGAHWGRVLLEGLEAYAERVHERALVSLPPQLVAALLDEAFAAQGLGRIEIDFGGHEQGVLGFAVRAADLPAALCDALYQAILSVIATGLSGHPLHVIAFGRHGEILRFAAALPEKATVLRRWRAEGMSANDVAQRSGLEVWT